MRTFRYDKLVRDKIVPDMEREGSTVVWHRLDDDTQFAHELARKLEEELDELADIAGVHRDKDIAELADIAEIYEAIRQLPMDDIAYELAESAATEIDAASDMWEIDFEELEEARRAKNLKFGAFTQRIYVETVTVEESNPWLQRYIASPDKYPEVISEA